MKKSYGLLKEAEKVLGNRGKHYGPPHSLFENVARRWSLTLGKDVSVEQVIMCMIDLKLARLNNSPTHSDSMIDVAGYAAILSEIAGDKK